MLKIPSFTHHHHVRVVPPDKVFFIAESGYQVISAESVAAVASLIDGKRSSDAIADELTPTVPLTQTYYVLATMEAKKYIQEATGDTVAAPALGFWAGLGVDAAAVEKQVSTRKVSMSSLGDVPSEGFVAALSDAGVQLTSGPSDLHVVLTDDYLRDGLSEHNRRALESGQSWTLVKPNGLFPWVGPIFRPNEGACYECLKQRLRANRQVDSYLRDVGVDNSSFPPRPFLQSTIAATLQIAVTEVAKWIVTGSNEALKDKLVSLNMVNLGTDAHVLVRRPQCPTCGDPNLERERPIPLELDSNPKVYTTDGAHRSVDPQQTLRKVEHHVSPVTGVVSRLLRITPKDDPLEHVYVSGTNMAVYTPSFEHLKSTLRSNTAGKGLTDIQAKVSAIGEAIERYCGTYRGTEPIQTATFLELGDKAIDPRTCMMFSDQQYDERERWLSWNSPFMRVPLRFDENATIDWSPVWSLTNQEIKYLPSEACYYTYPINNDLHFTLPDSNGCSAGNTVEEAIVQGFLELVERDAVCVWWYNRLNRPSVDLDSFDDPYVVALRNRHRALNRDLWVLDLTSDLNIPVFVAISRRIDKAREDIVFAPAAHFDPTIALHRAVTELNQLITAVGDVTDGEEAYAFDDEHSINWWQTATLENQPYLGADTQLRKSTRASFNYVPTEDLLDDIALCQAAVEARGLEMLVLNQTRPDIELPVVKVIVPGLRHFWARFAPGRLYDVPVQLGWLDEPLTEEELNPIPVFI